MARMEDVIKLKQEKIISSIGSVSGLASVLGSWQICHTVCLGLIAVLGLIGITITWMPLAFLTEITIPLWSIAVLILFVTVIIYLKKACVSKNSLLINSGLIIAGTPFQSVQSFILYFWIAGSLLVISGIANYFYNWRCCK